ncbi:M56 family metallopeptidase [Microbacterium stercoris]|uniref:M48 family metalloprotease n=1 Tax=Microbacterium stercoris TaxID=2820289 RepID=A0A939QNK8_9MICO|nr:M56 family metallopeptidase [Microbacterium stercoris]MBO3665022.1 M48 family metalloprotease [Microbacterium stercoris]
MTAVPWLRPLVGGDVIGAPGLPIDEVLLIALGAALVAVLLAWPVPILLSRAAWPARHPGWALLLWQLIAVAGGLAMIGALLLVGGALLPAAWEGLAYVLPIALALYLLVHLAITVVQFERQRRRHLELLLLLSSPHPTQARTRVLDDAAPVAYCLPRGVGSVTVLSQGLLDELHPDELDAVIAHERAHVEQRHEVLLVAFKAWREALPWFPIAAVAESEVAALVEMRADDSARRFLAHAGVDADPVLARAILRVAGPAADAAPATGRDRIRDRFLRLGR